MMSISQISETLFILTIPFFLSRYGIKNVMLISIVAWMLRFGLFAYGDPTPFGTVLLVLSMIVYGCAFDFFNISGSVFVEKEVNLKSAPAPRDVPDDDQRLRLYSRRRGER
jgi:NHS family nucleoside permease-like MFS transporter